MTEHRPLVVTGSLVLLVLSLFSLQLSAIPKAELQTDNPVFDFGEIREGKHIPVRFTVTNPGPETIEISEIRTFAACVQSSPLKKTKLRAGETAGLDFVFESLGYGGAEIKKYIEIHYNNRRKSPLKLIVKGYVRPLEIYQAPLGELTYNLYILIDIRPRTEFIKEHILGAINIPRSELMAWMERSLPALSGEIIIYLISADGQLSDRAAALLRERGCPQCLSLVGGLSEWKLRYGEKLLVSGEK